MTIWNEEMYVIKKMKQNLSASVMTNIKSNTLNGSELLIYTELPWRIFKSNKLKKLYICALFCCCAEEISATSNCMVSILVAINLTM